MMIKSTKKGFTLIEIIVVLALIGILSSLISVYVISSSRVSNTIKKEYDAVSEARIASSYLVNLIQKNDRSNAIKLDDKKLLKAQSSDGVGNKKDIEVYYDEATGRLLERADGKDNEIAQIASYDIKYDKVNNGNVAASITITIGYNDVHNNNDIKTMQQEITIRSKDY